MIQIPIDVFIGKRTGATLAVRPRAAVLLGDRAARHRARHPRARHAPSRRAGRLTWTTCATASHMWRRLVGARIRGQLQYRAVVRVEHDSASFVLTFIDFIVVLALFSHFHADGRLDAAGDRAALRAQRHRHRDRRHVRRPHRRRSISTSARGQFDVVLLRPVGTLLQVIVVRLRVAPPRARSRRRPSCSSTRWSPPTSTWNAGARAAAAARRSCARCVIFGATFVLGGCLTFWTVGSSEVANAFTYGGNYHDRRTRSTSSGPGCGACSRSSIPLAFVTYFPGLYLLDKPDPLGFPTCVPVPRAVRRGRVRRRPPGSMWRIAVRHYRSTGS